MRWWPLVVVAGCGMPPPPKQTVFPTLERDDTFDRALALPLHARLTDADLDRVAEGIARFA